MTIGILYEEGLKEYDFGPGHPFRGDRYRLVPRLLKEKLVDSNSNIQMLTAEPATDDDLLLICRQDYIDFTRGYYQAANQGLDYPGDFFEYRAWITCPRAGQVGSKKLLD